MVRIISFSAKITKQIGVSVAQQVSQNKSLKTEPLYIYLEGDLGAGKTTFTMGFLSYFKITPKAASPTFVIMKRYATKDRTKDVQNIVHMDAYRLHSVKDLDALGFGEIKKQPQTIVLIEWPGNIKGMRFKNIVRIRFEYGENETERTISLISK